MTDTKTTPGTTISVDEFRQQAREWIQANLARRPDDGGREARRDRTAEDISAARALQRKLFDAGFAGITYPAEYGGRGLTAAHERAFREEIWCQFYSEPEAGSDLAGIRTRATRDGDHWILNGSKIWSSGAYYADWAMCLARTDWDAPKHRGLTWFAVPTDAPGVEVRQITQINGNAEFCEEFLDDVVVTDADLIGEVNRGWTVTQTMLVYERGAGESNTAILEPRDLAPDLVALARTAGRLDDPLARQAIAKAHINDYAQFHLGKSIAARLRAQKEPDHAVAAYSKLAAGTMIPERARLALEIGGSATVAFAAGDDSAKRPSIDYLNGRQISIAAGTNEMQRNGIGERVLGLPREPSFDSVKPFNEVVRQAREWSGKIG